MQRLRVLPLGVLVVALLGTAAAVLRGPAAAGWRVLGARRGSPWPAGPEAGPDPFTRLLITGSAVLLAIACCWLAAAVAACTWEALRVHDAVRTEPGGSSLLRPPLVRLLVAACLGVGAFGPSPAHAQSTADVRPSAPPTQGVARGPAPLARLLEGLPVPDRATGGAGRSPASGAADSSNRTRHHSTTHPTSHPASHPVGRAVGPVLVVAPGDSLWALTARLLPDGAPESTVATGWHLLYAANRAVIGDDPDLLRPGQHLRVDRALTDLARSTAQLSSTTSTDRRSP